MKATYTIAAILLASLVATADALAFSNSRAEKWSFYLGPQFTNSKLLKFDNGAEADINEHSGIVFGLGYNVNHQLELGMSFTAGNSNYTGTRIAADDPDKTERFSANLYTSSFNLDVTWHFLKKPFTPYISANIGSTFIDSGIPTGNLGNICWWDPWWGYRCSPYAETYTSTEMNYGAGLGLRYDFNRSFYIKGGVAQNRVEINSSNTPDFTTWRFIFGFMF